MASIPQSWIDAILSGLSYVVSFFDSIAGSFSTVADYAADIPIVGGSLETFFDSISRVFTFLGDRVYTLRAYVSWVLNVINAAINNLDDLWNTVTGWISDKLDIAYTWARGAWDWIEDNAIKLVNDVYGWISDKLDIAYTWARGAWDWIVDNAIKLANDVYGWISDKLDIAYTWARGAWDWIVANADKIADLPALIKGEVLQFLGPVFNLVSFFFEDISDFFSDPADYFAKKVDNSAPSFSERLWGVFEKILEKIW